MRLPDGWLMTVRKAKFSKDFGRIGNRVRVDGNEEALKDPAFPLAGDLRLAAAAFSSPPPRYAVGKGSG